MPDFDAFSRLEFRKRKSRYHGIRKKENDKVEGVAMKSFIPLYDLSTRLREHDRHAMLSFLSSLPAVLRIAERSSNPD